MKQNIVSMTFDPQIAKEIDIDSAIIYQNIVFWIEKNKETEKNFYDGKYWTFYSAKNLTTIQSV